MSFAFGWIETLFRFYCVSFKANLVQYNNNIEADEMVLQQLEDRLRCKHLQ